MNTTFIPARSADSAWMAASRTPFNSGIALSAGSFGVGVGALSGKNRADQPVRLQIKFFHEPRDRFVMRAEFNRPIEPSRQVVDREWNSSNNLFMASLENGYQILRKRKSFCVATGIKIAPINPAAVEPHPLQARAAYIAYLPACDISPTFSEWYIKWARVRPSRGDKVVAQQSMLLIASKTNNRIGILRRHLCPEHREEAHKRRMRMIWQILQRQPDVICGKVRHPA